MGSTSLVGSLLPAVFTRMNLIGKRSGYRYEIGKREHGSSPSSDVLESILVRCLWVSINERGSNFVAELEPLAKISVYSFSELNRIGVEKCPFFNLPAADRNEASPLVKPAMVCQIKFTEWTRDDRLRQPAFFGIMEDKNANELFGRCL